jgi:DNA-binding CsgD family transcriptional regulator
LDIQLDSSVAQELLRLVAQIAPDVARPTEPAASRSKLDLLRSYRRRLLALDRGLTARELDVCSRSLLGMTAEGTALDLDIKISSVVTYRKRAYARLGISSQAELFHLLG